MSHWQEPPYKINISKDTEIFLKSFSKWILFDPSIYGQSWEHRQIKGELIWGEFFITKTKDGEFIMEKPFDSIVPTIMEFFRKEKLYDKYWPKCRDFIEKKQEEAVEKFKKENNLNIK